MGRTRKPLEGLCEMVVGYDSSGPGVRVIKCLRPGVERFDVPTFFAAPIVCDECYAVRQPPFEGEEGVNG